MLEEAQVARCLDLEKVVEMRVSLVREALHGGIFNGNSSRKLLKKCDLLLDCCPRRSQLAIVKPFFEVFKSLDLVVESCFGYKLQNDYLEKIFDFETKYEEANISLTPKYHIIITHHPSK